MYASLGVQQLIPADVPLLRALNSLFAEAFGNPDAYSAEPPCDDYLEGLLAKEHVIALAALLGQEVVGGLVKVIMHFDIEVAGKPRGSS
jgi:aminoglycoside 3-N-acetyltransferase I